MTIETISYLLRIAVKRRTGQLKGIKLKIVDEILAPIAPNLSLAFKGPFKGTAIKFILFKADLKPSDLCVDELILLQTYVEDSLNYENLKAIDSEFSSRMVEMGIDLKRYEKPADNDVKIKKDSSIQSNLSAPLILSFTLILGYFLILGGIFFVEISDTLNMKSGENSLMGEFKILIGVLTAGVGQTLSHWFSKK
jgi:hypothetical protein